VRAFEEVAFVVSSRCERGEDLRTEGDSHKALRPVIGDMPESPGAAEIPVYEDPDVRDRQYAAAESASDPYLAVERVQVGYAVTFDLLPAGAQLTPEAREGVRDRLHAEVETVVGDADRPERELSHNLGPALGSVAAFQDEDAARAVAAALAEVVLEEANWEPHEPPDGGLDPFSND
jgi:hypothetical protein